VRDLRPKAVTFDVTGTLIRSPRLGALYRDVFRRHGLPVPQDEAEVGRTIGRVWQEMACRTDGSTDRFAAHPEGAPGWWRRFGERVAEHLGVGVPSRFAAAELYDRFARPDAWELYPDTVPALDALRARGVRLGVISNWDERLPDLLEGLGLEERLDAVVRSSEIGYEKPDPRIFFAALDRMGMAEEDPEEIVHVGDRLKEDVEGAANVGLRAILIDRGGRRGRHGDEEVPEPATAVIRSLAELVG
jgi:putative hydrolase of the HAD superfamily